MNKLNDIETLRWDCKTHALKYFDSATKAGDKAVVFVEQLHADGQEWIKHFMERFNLTQEDLPTNCHMGDEHNLFTYTCNESSRNDPMTHTSIAIGMIAWIKYYFCIKDGEELNE